MRISVIGAGAVGSSIAQDLVSRDDIQRVRVCDRGSRSLTRLAAAIDSPKLLSHQVDARDMDALVPIFKDSDCVIGALDGPRSMDLARLAVSSGSHYCDLGAGDADVEAVLSLDGMARDAGRWIVPSCGLAPGLVNILCLHGVAAFDRVETASIRVGDLPLHPQPPFDFNISWSAEKVVDDYTGPVRLIEDGSLKVRESLTALEEIDFPEPFGTLEAFATAGGLSCLPHELEGRVQNLNLKTIRWPGHADRMRFLLGLGFAEPRSIDVRTHLTYRDLLVRRMRQKLSSVHEDVVLMRIVIHGFAGETPRTLRFEMIEHSDSELGLTAMKRCTSIPAAVVATQLASGRVPGGGAAPPEVALDAEAVLDAVRERGLSISEAWSDGHVPVAQT